MENGGTSETVMSALRFILLGLLVSATPGLSAKAAQCGSFGQITARVAVREPPIVLGKDFDLDELDAMASQSAFVARHPAFGFYRLTLGYAQPRIFIGTAVEPGVPVPPCPSVVVDAELVVTAQQIEIARDLKPCQVSAVLSHYRRHAITIRLALHRFADDLSPELEKQLTIYIGDHVFRSGSDTTDLREQVSELLDRAVGGFMTSIPRLQEDADTSEEIRSLTQSCATR